VNHLVPCTAMNPCPEESSLNINDFVGEGWAFIVGIFVAGFVMLAVEQWRLRRRYKATYGQRLEALRRVTPRVYDDEQHDGGAT